MCVRRHVLKSQACSGARAGSHTARLRPPPLAPLTSLLQPMGQQCRHPPLLAWLQRCNARRHQVDLPSDRVQLELWRPVHQRGGKGGLARTRTAT